MKGPITVNGVKYDGVMANQGLEAEEIADVMNHVLTTGATKLKQITPQEVVAIKKPSETKIAQNLSKNYTCPMDVWRDFYWVCYLDDFFRHQFLVNTPSTEC